MPASILFALLIAMFAVVFALQNATTVTISFLVWKFDGSLALLLLLTLAIGFLVGWLATTPTIFRLRRERAGLKKEVVRLEEALAEERTRLQLIEEQMNTTDTDKEQA